MHTLSDERLIKAYVQGDAAAFEILFNRHKQKIYSSIYLFVRCHDKANDIFQDTFVKAIDKLQNGQYKESNKFSSWILRIARNMCIDDYRINKRVRILHSTDDKDIFRATPSTHVEAEEDIVRLQTCNQVQALIEQLPPDQKEVVIMRHFYGLKFSEIAEELDENLNTVLGRMRYALIHLRKLIAEQNIEV